jgi:hypothetical protein
VGVIAGRKVMRAHIAVLVAVFGLAPGANAAQVTLHFDSAPPNADHLTTPYSEKGITATVDRGHYDLYADATGPDGDRAMNLDEDPNPGVACGTSQTCSKVTLMAYPASNFDVVSLDVVNPADTAGEYTISAIGGTGGSIQVPTTVQTIHFSDYAPAFHGVTALVIAQNSASPCGLLQAPCSHAFTFDELTVNVLPEPARAAALCAGALALAALRRRSR